MSEWRENIERVREPINEIANGALSPVFLATLALERLDALTAQIEELERTRDALFAAISAEPPDDETVRYFQRLHGLPEVGLIGDAARAEAAEQRVKELLDEADELLLWEPRKKGYAAAHDRFFAVVRKHRAALAQSDPPED